MKTLWFSFSFLLMFVCPFPDVQQKSLIYDFKDNKLQEEDHLLCTFTPNDSKYKIIKILALEPAFVHRLNFAEKCYPEPTQYYYC